MGYTDTSKLSETELQNGIDRARAELNNNSRKKDANVINFLNGIISDSSRELADRSKQNYAETNNLGSSFGFLKDYFTNNANNGDPNISAYRQQGQGAIKTNVKNNINATNEALASRGMLNSGIASAATANVYGQGDQALGQFETNLAEKDQQYRNNAIMGLLGLNQFEGNQNQGKANTLLNYDLQDRQLKQNQYQYDTTLNYQKDQSSTDFMDIIAGILGTGAGGFAGSAGSKLASTIFNGNNNTTKP